MALSYGKPAQTDRALRRSIRHLGESARHKAVGRRLRCVRSAFQPALASCLANIRRRVTDCPKGAQLGEQAISAC